MSDSVICHAPGVFAVGHLGELTQVVSFDLVDEALAVSGGLQCRVRRLPSRVVVYLLLAGALFTSMGWAQVWARLAASLPGPPPVPAGSSITEAMRRVGPAPLKALFDLVKGPAAVVVPQVARFAGRLVVAIDGTQIPLPDTPANVAVFPKANAGPNGPAGYPMLRLVTLVACGTRTLLDAVFGTDATGELTYARGLVTKAGATGALRPGMLLLGDRNFSATGFVTALAATGADFLIRAKTASTALKLPVLGRLPDGTFVSRIGEVTVRVIEATVTVTTAEGTVTHGDYRLLTSLLDPGEAPATALIRLYHERWEIETSYCELKSTILGGRVLRGASRSAFCPPSSVLTLPWRLNPACRRSRPTVGGDSRCPCRASSSARRRSDLVVHRSGDSGSPRSSGSTNASSAGSTRGFCSSMLLRPPPSRRTRPSGSASPPSSSSNTPFRTVDSLTPATRATARTPPCPSNRASAANSNRRCNNGSRGGRLVHHSAGRDLDRRTASASCSCSKNRSRSSSSTSRNRTSPLMRGESGTKHRHPRPDQTASPRRAGPILIRRTPSKDR